MYAQCKNANIFYEVYGKGRAVVLLHGFLENHKIWHPFAEQLAKSHKVIALDLPGHGKSENIGYVHSMELMAECVYEVLKQEKVRRACIVGHSMGGYVAMAFVDMYPDVVKKVCLFQSTARADSAEKKKSRNQAIKLVKENHKSFIRKAIPALFISSFRLQKRLQVNQLKKMALITSKQGIIAALEGMKIRPNREIILKFPPCPILFIAGKYDTVIPLKTIIEQCEHSSLVNYKIVPFAGHMAYLESPVVSFKILKQFLKP